MANKRFYQKYKQLAKKANQRMRELEKNDMKSPAYEAVQARLELMGIKSKSAKGRRFSETGKATYNEYQQMMKELETFLKHETSYVSKFKKYREKIWNTANEKYGLDELGISREEYYNIFQNESYNNANNVFGSDEIIAIIEARTVKGYDKKEEGKTDPDAIYSQEDILKAIAKTENLGEALKAAGISTKEFMKAKSLHKYD